MFLIAFRGTKMKVEIKSEIHSEEGIENYCIIRMKPETTEEVKQLEQALEAITKGKLKPKAFVNNMKNLGDYFINFEPPK
jgi:hypothetical protein